jgi:hypothetical protein
MTEFIAWCEACGVKPKDALTGVLGLVIFGVLAFFLIGSHMRDR